MIEVATDAIARADWEGIFALKAGKLGFTELECAWDGYVSWARRNGRVHIFSKEEDSAKTILSWVKFGLRSMPSAWGIRFLASDEREIPPDKAGTTLLRFTVLRGGIRDFGDVRTVWAYATGKFPAIDQSCQHSHIDEWAHMQSPKDVWSAVSTTIAPGGTGHIVTRGAGENKEVEDSWKAAVQRLSKLRGFFAPYTSRPGRDREWLEREAASHPTQASLAHFAAESPDDAFLGDDDTDFVPIELWDHCFDPSLATFIDDEDGQQHYEGRRGRWVGNLQPGDKRTLVLGADAGVSHDWFGIVASGRHPERPDDPAIYLCKAWRPEDFQNKVIDFATVEAWLRTVCEGGCVLGHPQTPFWKGGAPCQPMRDQSWEPGDCPACRDGQLIPPYNIYCVVYDPYQLAGMMQALRRAGVVYCNEVVQGGKRLTADRHLYDMIVSRRLSHMGDWRLREHIQNSRAKTQKDEDSKLRITKKAPHRHVDLAVAASMAVAEVMRLTL